MKSDEGNGYLTEDGEMLPDGEFESRLLEELAGCLDHGDRLDSMIRLGIFYLETGRLEESLTIFRHAHSAAGDPGKSDFCRQSIAFLKGGMDRGDEDFTDDREIESALWRTGGYFFERERTLPALSSFRRLLGFTADTGMKAACLLSIGQLMERTGRYDDAARYYTLAFPLGPGCDDTWYFLNNNLGYCLNILGRHEEAEGHCRAAIAINPQRHNAHKNLGLSLLGQGEYPEAASCLITATNMCPTDTRAFHHLENLIAQDRNLLRKCPDLGNQIEGCMEIIRIAGKTDRTM